MSSVFTGLPMRTQGGEAWRSYWQNKALREARKESKKEMQKEKPLGFTDFWAYEGQWSPALSPVRCVIWASYLTSLSLTFPIQEKSVRTREIFYEDGLPVSAGERDTSPCPACHPPGHMVSFPQDSSTSLWILVCPKWSTRWWDEPHWAPV